jgi:asparagine synthase (glutamine-hydrolysing)
LRFRADVPVGINLSGGLDSSTLLGLVQAVQGPESDVKAFTFVTGDARYDELPWVQQMLARTRHPCVPCLLSPADVPALAASVQHHQDEPFGGLPTLAYARLFELARAHTAVVLLDGQGMDEQWAGYEYYRQALNGSAAAGPVTGPVQASRQAALRPGCLTPEFQALAQPLQPPQPFPDALRNRQYLDACVTKIPRALRFNDRISMRSSLELREPFLDHRLFELALRQPPERKISGETHKWLLRRVARHLLPQGVVEAPKRPVQTPQREWLRGPLRSWADAQIERALSQFGGIWLRPEVVRQEWQAYQSAGSDNSFFVWQWVNLGLWSEACLPRLAATPGVLSN